MKKPSIQLQFLSQPSDVNFGGNVHGGKVMSWIDLSAYACASGWSEKPCVTVYVGGIRFIRPIKIPHLVRINARIIYTGKTSMHISVEVFSKDITAQEFQQATHCIIIFVAVDANGNPSSVPQWIPESAEDKKMETYAKTLMNLRKTIDEAMTPFLPLQKET